MMPHQSQGACMAIEDAAALGIIFSKPYFTGNVSEALSVYEQVRLPRATRVQAAAAKAAYNINERIGMCFHSHHKAVWIIDGLTMESCCLDLQDSLPIPTSQRTRLKTRRRS